MQKPPACIPCPLYRIGYSFSVPDGRGSSGVAIIGESLGDNEAIDGKPFRPKAASGSKLEEAFRANGVSREQFLLWNVIGCQPPGNHLVGAWYEQAAVNVCGSHFTRIVENGYKPVHKTRTILGLGNAPLKHLAGKDGYKQGISFMRGYVLQSKYGPFVASYHPAFIRRGKSEYTPYLIEDMGKALRVASGEYRPWEYKPRYIEYPSLDEAWGFYYKCKDAQRRLISYDIETPMLAEMSEEEREGGDGVDIKLIQFSHRKGFGIAFPWEGEYVKIAKKILRLANNKANHNTWNFDNPILRSKGCTINGRVDDTQWMFKHYHPALERGLQNAASLVDFPFPWKHYFGSKLNWYGCADVDAVQWLMDDEAGLPHLLRDRGLWEGYDRHVYEIHLELDKASHDRGIPINDEKRLELDGVLRTKRGEVFSACQELVPPAIRNIEPRHKDKATGEITWGFKNTKRVEKLHVTPWLEVWKRKRKLALAKGLKVIDARKYIYKKTNLVLRVFTDEKGEEYKRWVRVKPFLPTSSDQVIKYIKWKGEQVALQADSETDKEKRAELRELAKMYVVPKTIKEGKETTGKDALKELVEDTGDDLLGMIGEYRSLNKMITNDIPNWKPHKFNIIHSEGGRIEYDGVSTTWGFTAPTGQLNTRRPNIQNASKHTDVGDLFRRCIEAPRGYSIVEFDFRSFHVAIMGWRANDPTYIRFSQLDPHSIFTSYLGGLGLPAELSNISFDKSDAEILEICKQIKKGWGLFRQKVSKPAVLGNQLGLGPRKLWLANKKYIDGLHMAMYLQNVIAERFRKVAKAKEEIQVLGDKQKFLKNQFGRIQYFYEIFTWAWSKTQGRWNRRNGTDAEKALAFEVQSNAFGKVMEDILECGRLGYNDKYNFINTIHDSVVFMPETGKVDQCIADVVPILTRPCDKLWVPSLNKGLQVGVEASVGRNMGKHVEGTNDEGMMEVKLAV